MSTIRKEIINKPKNELILSESVESAPERPKTLPNCNKQSNAYSIGSQSMAIKKALRPMCFDILFTMVLYSTNRRIKAKSLNKYELGVPHDAGATVMRQ